MCTSLVRRWLRAAGLVLVSLGLVGPLLACSNQPESPAAALPASQAAIAPSASQGAAATPVPLRLLKVSPETGPAGTSFAILGEGLPPGREMEFQWLTAEGAWVSDVRAETIEFLERKFAEKRVSLGRASADAEGRLAATFTVPEDYGEVHDIYAVADGRDVARGGFRIPRTATMTPTEGPVGTLITITVLGLGAKAFEGVVGARYDNKYVGFASAVTTKGTATFQIRAAGPVGQHAIQLYNAGLGTTYLNPEQSPYAHLPRFNFVFTVTKDAGPPPQSIQWPDASRVAPLRNGAPRTTAGNVPLATGVVAALEPASAPILSQVTARAGGLAPKTEVELFWVTARGNRVTPSGWAMADLPLGKATTGADGSLSAKIEVPDDLGGWHTVKLVQGERVLAEIPFYLHASLVGVTPTRVKAGETFTVHLKGVGWTELDNGFGVTYDNSFIGYICGFNSGGDVTLPLLATGGPGTHLIDLYPMIYRGFKAKGQTWTYQIPQLTALQDHAALALGYRLPIIRLAIEVVE